VGLARLRSLTDSLFAVDAVDAAQQQPERAVQGMHRTRVARCAALGAGIHIEWIPAHTSGESADARLNANADGRVDMISVVLRGDLWSSWQRQVIIPNFRNHRGHTQCL
jgi:hypothetical protein